MHTQDAQRKAPNVGHGIRGVVHAAIRKPHPNFKITWLLEQAVARKVWHIWQHLPAAFCGGNLLAVQGVPIAITLGFSGLQGHKLRAVAGEALRFVTRNIFAPLGAGFHGRGVRVFLAR